jgi:hypothetical protein
MKHILKTVMMLAVLFGLLQLTGCAGYQRTPLTQASRDQITQTHVMVNGIQHHLIIHNNNLLNSHISSGYAPMPEGAIVSYSNTDPGSIYPNGTQGGLIQAIGDDIALAIGAHHDQENNKKDLQPILLAQGKDHVLLNFKHDLMAHLTKIHWLKAKSGQISYNLAQYPKRLKAGTANNVLFIGTTYALNSHMNQLEVTAYVHSLLHSKGKANAAYDNKFTYIHSIGDSADKAANQAVWMKNHAQLLRAKLKQAASVLSALIAYDIRHPGAVTAPVGAMQVTLRGTHDDFDGRKTTVPVLSHQHGRYTVLMPDGEMYNVNKRYLLS